MKRRLLVWFAMLAIALAIPAVVLGDVTVAPGGGTPGTSSNFELVGHDPLSNRGMNSQVTIYGHYAYIGNRTDGSSTCGFGDPRGYLTQNCPHPHPGILIDDISDPAHPTGVGEIGLPYAGQVGITTRELRVWPQKHLLMVMTFRCSSVIHACPVGNDTTFPFDIKFFDLTDPVHPSFISSYVPASLAGQQVKPHEMFLWVDPKNPDRALLWLSTPSVSVNPARPNLMIVDISDVPSDGPVHEVAEGNWNQFFPGAADPNNYDFDLSLHSMTPSFDGTRTYLAYLRGGFGVLDTSEVANDQVPAGTVENLNDKLLTPVPFPTWGTGPHCDGHHACGVRREPLGRTAAGPALRAHDRRGLRDVHGAVVRLALGLGTTLEHRPTAPTTRHRRVQAPAEHDRLHAGARRERVHLLLVAQPDRAQGPDLRLLALRRRAGDRRL
jgi:hypothetical protein